MVARRYTRKQEAEFKRRFIQKQRYQVAVFVPVFGAALLLLLSARHVPDLAAEANTIISGTAVLILGAVAVGWLNWRCPACRRSLGRRLSPDQCPRCGVTLAAR
jgi:rubrerythrin